MPSYCVFNVGTRRVGIPMTEVREIVEPRLVTPTPIPLMPAFVQGLFNLRGQVLPCLDLTSFLGADATSPTPADNRRAVIVERGNFRFATPGDRIDTIEADPASFKPLPNAAMFPALEAEAQTERGAFHVVHLDRLEACLGQTLKFTDPRAATT